MNNAVNFLMQLLRLHRIGVRLALSYFFLIALFIVVVSMTVLQIQHMAESHEQFAQTDMRRLLSVQALSIETEGIGGQLLMTFSASSNDVTTGKTQGSPRKQTERKASSRPDYSVIDEKTRRLRQLMGSLEKELSDEDQQTTLKALKEKHVRFQAEYDEMLNVLEFQGIENNGIESAKIVFVEKVEPARQVLLEESKNLLENEKKRIELRQLDEQKRLKEVELVVIALSFFAVLVSSVSAFITRRSVVKPLENLETSALQIASGNYESRVPGSKIIEIERVGSALNSMAEAIGARETEIEQLAYYDPLTHLPNRTLLLKNNESGNLTASGLILLDIARLKTVNETLGFGTGDAVILETSRRIQQALSIRGRGYTSLTKFSGGMFAILCSAASKEIISDIIAEIDQHLSEPVRFGQHTVDVNMVYGIAVSSANTLTLNTLIRNAEVALYAAKANTQAVIWYSDAQEASRLSHLSLLSDLRMAVQNSELQMWLQPKIHLHSMETFGFEALVRWQHPKRGFISPAEFVPFAERTGYISTVTKWMLERAMQTLVQWKTDYPQLSIAVNVSTNDLRDQQFPDRVRDLMEKYAVDPKQIKLELTESGIMEDPSSSIPLLQKLRDTGIGLSIDDFGTGHSSLAYLQKLPVNELKIDRSFVVNIDQLPSTQRLVRTIVEMGHGLNLSVIAEGIETKEERDTLLELGCDSMQGYFASKPLHGEALQAWLAKI